MRAIGKHIILKETKESGTLTAGGLELGEKHREDIRYRKGTVALVGEEIMLYKQVMKFILIDTLVVI